MEIVSGDPTAKVRELKTRRVIWVSIWPAVPSWRRHYCPRSTNSSSSSTRSSPEPGFRCSPQDSTRGSSSLIRSRSTAAWSSSPTRGRGRARGPISSFARRASVRSPHRQRVLETEKAANDDRPVGHGQARRTTRRYRPGSTGSGLSSMFGGLSSGYTINRLPRTRAGSRQKDTTMMLSGDITLDRRCRIRVIRTIFTDSGIPCDGPTAMQCRPC